MKLKTRYPGVKKKKFGLIKNGQEKYPTNTPGRAVAAKAYAKQGLNKGRLSPQEYHHIVNKANTELK